MKLGTASLARAIIYGLALIYIFADLFVVKGPLFRAIKNSDPRSEKVIAEETAKGVAARVFYQPVLLTQIDRTIERRFWLRGKSTEGLAGEDLRQERMAALNEIFEEHLLRIKVRFNSSEVEVSDAEVAAAVKLFKKRFPTEKLLDGATSNQGWKGEEELVARVRAKLEQEAYLKKKVAVEVSPEELQNYYELNRHHFLLPERVKVRHLFFAALQHPDGQALSLAKAAQRELAAGQDFAEIAAARSEDSASQKRGGELGWMTRERLPNGMSEALFSCPVGGFHVVESELGAHVVEVWEKRPAREKTYAEVKDELGVALTNQKREEGVQEYLRILHHRESNKLEAFLEVLDRPWSFSR